MSVRVGVLAVQGAVSEHMEALRAADPDVEVIAVRTKQDLASVQGLVMPGGESTTISRLLRSGDLQDDLVRRAKEGSLALFGTCAGMILLGSRATHDVDDKDIQLLGLLDIEVDRNAFGRQRESFEAALDVEGIGPMPAVFIRAPAVTDIWGETKALASTERGVVACEKGNVLATAFHPELTPDVRLHQRFLDAARAAGPTARADERD